MNKKTKEILKQFLAKQHLIPKRIWRDVLWLQKNEKLGITRDKRFIWNDNKGKHNSNWQNFFRSCKVNWNDHEILDSLVDYQLFFKLNSLTAREVLNCKNMEIRRLLMRAFDTKRLFRELGGIVEHQDGDSQLIIVKLGKNIDIMKIIKVKDSTTGEFYILRVPPAVHTCKEAIAWTFGMTVEEYKPIKET
ncbi:MAG: DUF6745 domain-containing protein [Candidatus Helarchaeota archaeon]